jgi:hypothetical protein
VIWLTNDWKLIPNPKVNPGGNSIAVMVGAACPIKTPLIGPPVPFHDHHGWGYGGIW